MRVTNSDRPFQMPMIHLSKEKDLINGQLTTAHKGDVPNPKLRLKKQTTLRYNEKNSASDYSKSPMITPNKTQGVTVIGLSQKHIDK